MLFVKKKINWWLLKDILIIIAPLILFLWPMEWLENGHSICLIKNIFGCECYGCGITRAIVSAVQLDFGNAFNYNKLIIIVFPLLLYVWFKTLIIVLKKKVI